MASSPFNEFWCSKSRWAISTSADPPPVIKDLLLTRDLITQRASCRDLSASSMTKEFEPRTNKETVLEFLIPVILKTLLSSESLLNSQRAADPNLSAERWSICATGTHPRVLQMNYTSSLSMSWTTIIPFFARKWRES